jgi:AcrR family transcriptional regulator
MSNLDGGRTNQKMRTYIDLVECAAQFVREGKTFTVADVADRAKVGRTTAYRYFPSVEMLIAQASLHATTEVEKDSIGAAVESKASAEERLRAVIEASDKSVADHEYLYRTMLRMSLAGDGTHKDLLPHRVGARKGVLGLAIGSLRAQLGDKRFERLTAALSLFLGIESTVVLKDVCMLPANKARDVKVWAAGVLLAAALAEASQDAKPAAPRKATTPVRGAREDAPRKLASASRRAAA